MTSIKPLLDKATEQKLREALRFSASRSVMSASDEARILSALTTPPADADLKAENERLQEQLSACMEMVDPSAMELGTYKARAFAAEAREQTLREALQKIADAPAWGYPERWEATPSEVRHLARAALKGGE